MTPTSQAALGRLLAAALLLMVPLYPGCSCSGSGGSGGLPGPSRPRALSERTVAELVTPFDVHRRDLLGPNDHNAMYGMRPEIIALLAKKYAEAPVAIGLSSNGGVVEVLSSMKNQSWTMIITMPDGNSCLMAAGENWETIKTVAYLGPGA